MINKNQFVIIVISILLNLIFLESKVNANIKNVSIISRDAAIYNKTNSPLIITQLGEYYDDNHFAHSLNQGDTLEAGGNMDINMSNESVFPVEGVGFKITLESPGKKIKCSFVYHDPATGTTYFSHDWSTNCNTKMINGNEDVELTFSADPA